MQRGGEYFESHDAAEVAPEVAVGRHGDSGVVVVEVFSGKRAGAVRKYDIMFRVAFFGGGRGRDQEDFA